jgi:hypothetical protein
VITWVLFLKKNEDPDWAPKIGGVGTSECRHSAYGRCAAVPLRLS